VGSHTGSPFPPNLRVLELRGFKSLKILPTLPISLEKLVLRNCESISEFSSLPPHLKELELRNCDQIKFIGSDHTAMEGIGFRGKIPTLKNINLDGLSNLTWIGKLQSNFETLKLSECRTDAATMSSLPRYLVDLAVWA
jgi:hypothetical protein